jgi:hypothetical protein
MSLTLSVEAAISMVSLRFFVEQRTCTRLDFEYLHKSMSRLSESECLVFPRPIKVGTYLLPDWEVALHVLIDSRRAEVSPSSTLRLRWNSLASNVHNTSSSITLRPSKHQNGRNLARYCGHRSSPGSIARQTREEAQ